MNYEEDMSELDYSFALTITLAIKWLRDMKKIPMKKQNKEDQIIY